MRRRSATSVGKRFIATSEGRRVGVVGGGIGGLAAAVCLARRGAHVTVLERADAIAEIGAGIQVSPNAWRVLRAMGLGAAVRAIGLPARHLDLIDGQTGRRVARVPLGRARDTYLLVHRADLLDVLLQAAQAAGVVLRTGVEVQAVNSGAGAVAHDGGQERFDLIVGADGIGSVARPMLDDRAASFTGQVAWRALIPGRGPGPVQVYLGTGGHAVLYPLRGGAVTNLVLVEERDAWQAPDWRQSAKGTALAEAASRIVPALPVEIAAWRGVRVWGLHRRPVARTWWAGRLVLLGDAAHPMLPFLAQGAAMALEDAWVLGAALDDWLCGATAPDLDRYATLRRARVTRVVARADRNATFFHLAPGLLRTAGHAALTLGSTVTPWVFPLRHRWLHDVDVTGGAALPA